MRRLLSEQNVSTLLFGLCALAVMLSTPRHSALVIAWATWRSAPWWAPESAGGHGLGGLRRIERVVGPVVAARPAMLALAVMSGAWSLWAFWPARPESHLRPTPLAAGCGPRIPRGWILRRTSRPAGALCYANLTERGYEFRAKASSSLGFLFAGSSTWPEAALAVAGEHARRRGWTSMQPVRDGDRDRWLRASAGIGRIDQFNAAEGCLLALRQVQAGAQVSVRLPSRAVATAIVAGPGGPSTSFPVDAPPGELVVLDVPGPADVLLLVVDYDPR
jgi:hypothetical protein